MRPQGEIRLVANDWCLKWDNEVIQELIYIGYKHVLEFDLTTP